MSKRLERGAEVIVRCWRDEPAVMRVWEASADRVALVAPDEFERMLKGESELFPISFRRADVFQSEDELFGDLLAAHQSGRRERLAELWASARPMNEALN